MNKQQANAYGSTNLKLLFFTLALVCGVAGASGQARSDEGACVGACSGPWTGLSRVWVGARPYVGLGKVGVPEAAPVSFGALGELGAEVITSSGFLIGAELAPAAYDGAGLHLGGRLVLGYGGEALGVSIGLGSNPSGALRVGRFDRTYATLRLTWSVDPPTTLPAAIDLTISTPLGRKVRAQADLGAWYGNGIGVYATGSVQYVLCKSRALGLRGTSLLKAGAGVSWVQFSLGPMFTLGYERRF